MMLKTGENIVTVEDCEDSDEEKQQRTTALDKQNKRLSQRQSQSQSQDQGSQSADYEATTESQLGSEEGVQPLKGQTSSMEQVTSSPSILAELSYVPWQYKENLLETQGGQPRLKPKAKLKTRWQQIHEKRERQVSRVS